MADKRKIDETGLIFNLAKYTYKHGPVISGAHAAFPMFGNLIDKRDEILHFIQRLIELLEEKANMSTLTHQVLSNVNQQVNFKDLRTVDVIIEYISNWMEKISEEQALLPDEKLVMRIFNSDIYLKDLDIDKIAKQISGLNSD